MIMYSTTLILYSTIDTVFNYSDTTTDNVFFQQYILIDLYLVDGKPSADCGSCKENS